MSALVVIGEAMLELREKDASSLHKSFAGDVLNTAVYAKRFNQQQSVEFMTGVGNDNYSQQLVEQCKQHGVGSQYCWRHDTANIGIYSISTDNTGERFFTYWRKGSAASKIIDLLDAHTDLAFAAGSVIYFSGISLAILSDQDKNKFLQYIQTWQEQGLTIAFDPNYRARLWRDKQHAQSYFDKCYALADILLPGLDDHMTLYGHNSPAEIEAYIKPFGYQELIIKSGKAGVFGFAQTGTCHVPFKAAAKQVDATAAGDSFAGTYMAARLRGDSVEQSIIHACDVARVVVQFPGAILPADVNLADYT
ncbi:PfkB protein [Catenovulum agarivorans DS-2]|uniref:PfkB protein n=1 Tax=Catenovulum agarivorans DS-2 TaxID=1328313 RepID=W7Q8R9_9ALTE|nr:sugar kinase [Catenovulum agarivorans]EWH08406.1 PfkB protein [Catenovulum agarivorans DS-2]